eukprot:2434838-Amphidinium_carterae.1
METCTCTKLNSEKGKTRQGKDSGQNYCSYNFKNKDPFPTEIAIATQTERDMVVVTKFMQNAQSLTSQLCAQSQIAITIGWTLILENYTIGNSSNCKDPNRYKR